MPRRDIPDPVLLILGQLVRRLRMERGLSLSALAAKAELNKGHLSSIESGRVSITLMVALRLARVLGTCPICSYLAQDPSPSAGNGGSMSQTKVGARKRGGVRKA